MNKLLGAAAALSLVAFAAPAFAADNATATATANIITPVSVTKNVDLVFGNILSGPSGTVTVSNAGARTATGATILAGTTPAAAKFTVVGDTLGGTAYTVAYTTVNLTGLGAPMAIGTLTPSSTGTLTGTTIIDVGATLTVGAAQTPGVYTGSITATATYN